VKVVLEFLQLVLFFVISFFIVKKIDIFIKTDKYKKKNNYKTSTKDNHFQNLISKISFLRTKENFLSKQGFPLKLNIAKYYTYKIFFALLFFSTSLLNYSSTILPLIFLISGYFLIDIYILLNKKSRDNEICIDLLNVVDSICLQLSADVSLKDAFKKQYENCKNRDFKKALIIFSTKYELSELNIDLAIKELKNRFDILEIDMFCSALCQYNKTGNIIEILENLTEILKNKYIRKLKETTNSKIILVTFGVVIATSNIILMTFYPLFISIGQGFNVIFK
jgi:Flp pilus assembly protein TadB